MNNLSKRFRPGGPPSVERLFARSQGARTVMNGPSMMAVLGVGARAGVAAGALGGFAGNLGNFGALPSFAPPDVGEANDVLESSVNIAQQWIQQARQVQAQVAPLLARPDAAGLAGAVAAAEASISDAWDAMVGALRGLAARRREAAAARAVHYPVCGNIRAGEPCDPKYFNYGMNWGPVLLADQQAWTQNVTEADSRVAGALAFASEKRDLLNQRLRDYVANIPAAADAVTRLKAAEDAARQKAQDLTNAKTELSIAQTGTATAETAVRTTALTTQKTALQIELDALKVDAAKARAASTAAIAKVEKSAGGSKLPWLLGGALAIGVGVYLFKRKR